MFIACKSANGPGAMTRCPKMARSADGYCAIHATTRYPLPEVGLITVRIQLTEELAATATQMGVRVAERSDERQTQLVSIREAESKAKWGRSVARTGTQIFGCSPLEGASIKDVITDMTNLGYRLADSHIVYWWRTNCDHFYMMFRRGEEVVMAEDAEKGQSFFLDHLAGGTYKVVAYHNPPSVFGNSAPNLSIDCTMMKGVPKSELRYMVGDWVVAPINYEIAS